MFLFEQSTFHVPTQPLADGCGSLLFWDPFPLATLCFSSVPLRAAAVVKTRKAHVVTPIHSYCGVLFFHFFGDTSLYMPNRTSK